MNVSVKEFMTSNKNNNVTWTINDETFRPDEIIPDNVLEKTVMTWTVNQWEGIITITTNNRETVHVYVPKTLSDARKLLKKFKDMNLEHLDETKFMFYCTCERDNVGFCVRDNTWQLIPLNTDLFNIIIIDID